MLRKAEAQWNGGLQTGSGSLKTGSGTVEKNYSFKSRFGDDTTGTNPEELIAAAHAGCYSMALSFMLESAGHAPESVHTVAQVKLEQQDGGFTITHIELTTQGKVPGLTAEQFLEFAENAKKNCPVSKALAAVEMSLNATLV
jgi:lipoyl-dependent peroxiredoxin